MDVRDRSNYTSSVESSSVEASSRLRTETQSSTASTATARGQDSSDLSSAAHVASQAAQLPEIRQERISALQEQIASGTYSIAPQDVADAMLRTLRS